MSANDQPLDPIKRHCKLSQISSSLIADGLVFTLQQAINRIQTPQSISLSSVEKYLSQAKLQVTRRLLALIYKEQFAEDIRIERAGNGEYQLILPLSAHKKLMARPVISYSLSQLEINGDIILQSNKDNETTLINNPTSLLDLLPDSKLNQPQFIEEVNNGIANEALFLIYRNIWREKFKQRIQKSGYHNFWKWLDNNKNDFDYIVFFEQWGAVGHPYHPNPKTKLNVSFDEVLRYSPEFEAKPKILLMALHRDYAFCTNREGDFDSNTWLNQLFPDWMNAWKKELRKLGHSDHDYIALPVHPWQAQHTLANKFSDLIAEKKLLLLKEASLPCYASMTLRTVIPENQSAKHLFSPHIKLPIGFYCTSVMRTLSPGSVRMSPRMSQILSTILKKEEHFSGNLDLCADFAGIHLNYPDGKIRDDIRHLSVLFRENPYQKITEDEIAITVATLFAKSPTSPYPILYEIMQYSGVTEKEHVKTYFKHYVQVVLQGYLDLYLIYGIAMEAHQQNTLAIFKQGQLVRMLSRDLGGIRVHLPTLRQQGFDIKQDVPTLILTNDPQAVRYKIIHAIMQSHLGQIIVLLVQHFNITEKTLWQIVSGIILERFDALKNRVDKKHLNQEKTALFNDDWPIKAFTRMRLSDKPGYIFVNSKQNPLRD